MMSFKNKELERRSKRINKGSKTMTNFHNNHQNLKHSDSANNQLNIFSFNLIKHDEIEKITIFNELLIIF